MGSNSRFCPAHHGECKMEGCRLKKMYSDGYCDKHHKRRQVENHWPETAKQAKAHAEAYEWVQRLKRKAGLREQHIDTLLAKQDGRCAKSFKTCEIVRHGYATPMCPYGDRRVPTAAADVDHIVPLADGGTDDEDNLQVLCACCHRLKTTHETHMRKLKRIREEARAKEEDAQKYRRKH